MVAQHQGRHRGLPLQLRGGRLEEGKGAGGVGEGECEGSLADEAEAGRGVFHRVDPEEEDLPAGG